MGTIALETEPARKPWADTPRGQEGFCSDFTHAIIGAEGGWGGGKTYCGGAHLFTNHQINAFFPNGQPTYCASLIVAPSYADSFDYCLPEIHNLCAECNMSFDFKLKGLVGEGGWAAPAIVLPDLGTKRRPSVILIRSAEEPGRITGFKVGSAWGDEPARWWRDPFNPKNDAIVQIPGRVRDGGARIKQIIYTYTNEGDMTKIFEEMHKAGADDRALYRLPTKENREPAIQKFYKEQSETLTKELADQYLDGKAVSLSGNVVYTSFDFDLHVDNKLTYNPLLPLQASFDFNIEPGMHCEIGQYDYIKDQFTCIDEIFERRMDVVKCTDALVAMTRRTNWKWTQPLEIFGDPSGQSATAHTSQSCYDIIFSILKQNSIPYRMRVFAVHKPVNEGVAAFNIALKDVVGEIHYKIHPRCVRLIDDMRRLRRDKWGDVDKSNTKLSHASEAERNRISYLRPIKIIEIPKPRFLGIGNG